MASGIVIFVSFLYLVLLFVIAIYGNKKSKTGQSIVNNPYVYALSWTVYCTVWTFYGSVGKASAEGLSFLPVYLGPTLAAPVLYMIIRKLIRISKKIHITSIADFVSSRYGNNTIIGVITTCIVILGIIPYISIQLNAIGLSFETITQADSNSDFWDGSTFYRDKVNYFTLLLAVFTILFGTRSLDPNERHEGLIAAIAFESVIKLISFLSIGIFVTYYIFDGFGDIFNQALYDENCQHILTLPTKESTHSNWFWVTLLSASAVLLLPRQFHVSVVENTNITFTRQASWMFPLYLFLMCVFVLPIAIAGNIMLPEGVNSDTFVLSIPLFFKHEWIALLVYIGGFSAAASMVVVSVIAMSIMISNNLLMPLLLKTKQASGDGYAVLSHRLLNLRRLIIVVILFLAYAFYKSVSHHFPLVSIGLISFAAILQLAPAIIGGLYWTRANRKGALFGMLFGFFIWLICLPIPTLAESGIIPQFFVQEGYFSLSWLKPYALFGLKGFDPISHACFWSMTVNVGFFVGFSLLTNQDVDEFTQADLHVNIERYVENLEPEILKREASVQTLQKTLSQYLGKEKTQEVLNNFHGQQHLHNLPDMASPEFINYVEKILSGSFGAASAKLILRTDVSNEPLTLEQVQEVLYQTKEILEYSYALESKTTQLQETSRELEIINSQLKRIDELKAEFISTVTHELRTPMTTIRSFAQIIQSKPTLDERKKAEFLEIIIQECDRVKKLINQVLEVEKIDSMLVSETGRSDLKETIEEAVKRVETMIHERGIDFNWKGRDLTTIIKLDKDKLLQILLNVLSNAIKFCDQKNGKVDIVVEKFAYNIKIGIWNNGKEIPESFIPRIFEKFTQFKQGDLAKPEGSGLGLYITKKYVEEGLGNILISSEPVQGTMVSIVFPLFGDSPQNYIK